VVQKTVAYNQCNLQWADLHCVFDNFNSRIVDFLQGRIVQQNSNYIGLETDHHLPDCVCCIYLGILYHSLHYPHTKGFEKSNNIIGGIVMVKLNNIVKIYNSKKANEFKALHGVSAEIRDGELIAIIGKSGAGKSTLLHILACIDNYQEGEYYIDDVLVKDLSESQYAKIRNEKIGMVMQDFALVEDFTALENVMIPLNFSKKKVSDKKEKALAALKSVGIEELAKKLCSKLSGGQKQRVAIARAIVNEPSMILADEPTGALDTKTSAEIMELFKSLNKQGRTVVIVTHDPKIAEQCGRVIEISDGNIVTAK